MWPLLPIQPALGGFAGFLARPPGCSARLSHGVGTSTRCGFRRVCSDRMCEKPFAGAWCPPAHAPHRTQPSPARSVRAAAEEWGTFSDGGCPCVRGPLDFVENPAGQRTMSEDVRRGTGLCFTAADSPTCARRPAQPGFLLHTPDRGGQARPVATAGCGVPAAGGSEFCACVFHRRWRLSELRPRNWPAQSAGLPLPWRGP